MKKRMELPDIPMLKKPVIAINIDFKKKKEHLVIGDCDNVNAFVRGQKNIEIIFEKIRPLGSFLLDIITEPEYFADVKANFCETSKEKYAENLKVVEGLYEAENPVLKYIALSLWDEYGRIVKADKEKDEEYPVLERMEDLTLPFRYSLINNILFWQKHKPFNPLMDMPTEYYRYPALTLVIPQAKGTTEYIASDFTLFPLIIYYLRTIYEHKKYFNYCKVCGKLFFPPDYSKTTICSDKCKEKQQKVNKKKYDESHKDIDYEKAYKNETQYWRNRINKAKRHKLPEEEIERVYELYDNFKTISLKMKKDIEKGKFTYVALDNWFLDQREVINKFMEDNHIDKRC